ncbi:MAG: SDR family NAD(P)-dependent oxidoreductase [Verrucomicrobiota bacterium]
MHKIALITGANKGIGFETASQLAARGFRVYVTARSTERGQIALKNLRSKNHDVHFVALDVTDPHSIQNAADHFATVESHLDVLVNNAAIYPDRDRSILDISQKQLSDTLLTNSLGPLLIAQTFWPYLKKAPDGGRIINLSSGLGQLHQMEDETPTYAISKTTLNAITRQLAGSGQAANISVNSVCPGWVRTDMGGPGATRSVDQGADTVVWLATDAPQNLSAQFLRDRQPIPW